MDAIVQKYWEAIAGLALALVGALYPDFNQQVSNLLIAVGAFFGISGGHVAVPHALTKVTKSGG
jgi:hypothetical protein